MDDGVTVGSPSSADTGASGTHTGEPPSGGPLTFSSSAIASNSALTGGDDAPSAAGDEPDEGTRVSAYARLDFDSFTFYVQTLQVFLGRRAQNGQNMVDVHLGGAKAISRRHAKIFYNFATQRFEFTVMGRNGAFVGGVFVENGSTVPLRDNTRIQIGQINFKFVLPNHPKEEPQDSHDPDATELHERDVETDSNEDEANFFAQEKRSKPKVASTVSKEPPKPKKREYLPEEIPVQYREKPQLSYSALITQALQDRAGEHGLSLADIYEAIMDIFPYYRYCPSGWQNSVRHNLSSSKAFRKVSKEGKGWLWGLDLEYISEKEQKRAASKQRRPSNDKSIAELAQEIPARRPSESARPRTESGNLLSPALIRLLARLQTQLQGYLAKAGGKSINPNILSNALANVVARAAKASGGIDQLEQLLQSPQQVNIILVQALEFVKFQRRRSDADPNTVPPEVKQEAKQEPAAQAQHQAVQAAQAQIAQQVQEPPAPALQAQAPVQAAPVQAAQTQAQPQNTQPSASPAQPAPIAAVTSVPSASAPVAPAVAAPVPQTAPAPAPAPVPVAATPAAAPAAAPAASTSAAPAPSKPKYTPEQIAKLIAQAEKVENPSPAILAAIEQLRAHQRMMLKRPANGPEPPVKRPTTTNEA